MIIDMHASMIPDDGDVITARRRSRYLAADPAKTTLKPFLKRMDASCVDRSVVWWNGRSAEECRHNNDFIAEMASMHPDRLIPFATLWPHDVDAARQEAIRAITVLDMAGIKLHPIVLGIDIGDPAFLAVVELARDLSVPFVTHVDFTVPAQLGKPELLDERAVAAPSEPPYASAAQMIGVKEVWDSPKVQAAHMGGLYLEEIRDSAITFQTTGALRDVIQWAVDAIGAERIVFGSDFPFFLVEDELAKVASLSVSEVDKAAILSGNALQRVLPDAWV